MFKLCSVSNLLHSLATSYMYISEPSNPLSSYLVRFGELVSAQRGLVLSPWWVTVTAPPHPGGITEQQQIITSQAFYWGGTAIATSESLYASDPGHHNLNSGKHSDFCKVLIIHKACLTYYYQSKLLMVKLHNELSKCNIHKLACCIASPTGN